MEIALEDYKLRMKLAPGMRMPPIAVFLFYHLKLMELLKSGRLNTETYAKLSQEHDELFNFAFSLSEKRAEGENPSESASPSVKRRPGARPGPSASGGAQDSS